MFSSQVAAGPWRFTGSLLGLSLCALAAVAGIAPALAATPGSRRAPAGGRTIKFRPAPGGVLLGVAGESAVIGNQHGGPIATFDLRTGKRRRVLVPAARSGMPSREGALIDSYARGTVVLHGALVGPSGGFLSSIDVESGKTRWRIQPRNPPDEFFLRDNFQGVAVGALDVYGISESVLAVDPASGKEKWRTPFEHDHADGALRLAVDDTQILAATATRVVALDPANGSERWRVSAKSVSWSQEGYPFALRTERLAIATRTGFVQILDTRTGRLQSEVALPAGATLRHLALGAQVLLAALEQASPSGVVSLAAFSLPSGRPIWTVAMPSSVLRLTIQGEAAYVDTIGYGLRSLDVATGKERFSMEHGGPFVLAPTPTEPERLVLSVGVVVPALASSAPLQEPYLRFDFVRTDKGRCRATMVSWVDGADRVVWTASLPERVRAMSSSNCEGELDDYVHNPRQHRHLRFLMGVLELDGSVFIADPSGVLVLEQSSGKPLLDLALPYEGKHSVNFDVGRFVLTGKPACKGPADGAQIFQRCQNRVLYFDGNRAALLRTRPPRLEVLGTYEGHRKHISWTLDKHTLKLGKGTLTLEGTILKQ